MMTHTLTLDCLHKRLLHAYKSVSLARMWRYTQLAYLLHQCATGLLSRDVRIADCTVRYPGLERPFSSLNIVLILCGAGVLAKIFGKKIKF